MTELPVLEVSRETRAKLELYQAELVRWQGVKNLVGRSTLPLFWSRHVADSLQLADLADGAVWADLGSGAGFPGLVLAIARPDLTVHLVDSDSRRCSFLRHVVRLTGASAEVTEGRIEQVAVGLRPVPVVVVARALAPLPRLLELAAPLLSRPGTVGLFPKGQAYAAELTEAAESWRFTAEALPSRADPGGRIVLIRDFDGRNPRPGSAP